VRAELDAAIGEVDRLAHTVEELLVLSRAGERRASGTTIDLCELASSAVARWQAPATGRGVRIVHRHEGPAATAWSARPDAERALDCLLENAVNYSPFRGLIEVVSRAGRIEVRDRGPGLAAEEREAVFDRFHRGGAGRAGPPGSGLGLAIARELARAWNGDVVLDERKDGGTVAVLSLPGAERFDPRLQAVNRSTATLGSS
jgi:signal transduction histidine kinase